MNRIVAILLVGVLFLVPATSWSKESEELLARIAQLEALVASLKAQLDDLDTFVMGLENYVSVDTTNHRITFTGVNLQLVNGTGNTGGINGKGNFIIGYDEARTEGSNKSGSHNLVMGIQNNYSGAAGLVAGAANTIGNFASVSGGAGNTASGLFSVVSGGEGNTASGRGSSVSGGLFHQATGVASSISGGSGNTASGTSSSVSGGSSNTASDTNSSVSGGYLLEASSTNGYAPYP